jgi:hypothetical protein
MIRKRMRVDRQVDRVRMLLEIRAALEANRHSDSHTLFHGGTWNGSTSNYSDGWSCTGKRCDY